jgi:hypothetical protein
MWRDEVGMRAPATCEWCERPFEPRLGGSPQRFCGTKCRSTFWSALRRFAEQAIAAGTLTIADVKNGVVAACTPLQDIESPVQVFGNGAGDPAPDDALLRFIVDFERSKLTWLVRLGLIRPDQQDDLLAIITALKRLGQPARISRIA